MTTALTPKIAFDLRRHGWSVVVIALLYKTETGAVYKKLYRNSQYKSWSVERKWEADLLTSLRSKGIPKDKTRHNWVHKDGRTYACSRDHLTKEFSLRKGNMQQVINGRLNSTGGWALQEAAKHPSFKWSSTSGGKKGKIEIQHEWRHRDGRTFKGSVKELHNHDPAVTIDNASRIASRLKGYQSAGGWFIGEYVENRGGRNRMPPAPTN